MAKSLGQGRVGNLLGNITSLRPRLSRRKALEISVLGMTLVLAVVFRVIRVRWGAYLDAFDPLFQYRVTEYVVKNGYAAWFNWHDTLSWYPMGRDIFLSSYPGVPFSAAFIYNLLQALGFKVSVYNVCLYFPVLMSVVTCVTVYFLGKDLGGSSVGLFSAFFLAVSEAFISRTALGFFDTENIGIFGMAATALFFLRSIEEEKQTTGRVAYAVAAGLILGYIFASWGAARYVVGLLALFMIASVITNIFERRYIVSYAITMGVGFNIALFVPKLGLEYLLSIENVAVIFLIAFVVIYEFVRNRFERRKALMAMGGLLILLVVGVFALESLGVIRPLSGKILRVVDPRGASKSPLYESVAEHKRSAWSSFFGSFGLTFALGMLGTYFALTDPEEKGLYGAIFFVSSVYFAGVMSRLALILSVSGALMAAYGLKELITPFIELSGKREDTRRGRRGRTVFGVGKEFAVVFSVFIFVAALPAFWGTAESSYSPASIASSQVPVKLGGSYPQDWLQALSWLRDNTPEDAIVVSWWDQGYWIEAMANRTTLADGSTSNRRQIATIAEIMMFNETESIPLLQGYGADYIVVYQVNFNPSDPSKEWPFGYNAIWAQMVRIARLNMTDYIDENGYKQKFLDSTLAKLMSVQPGPAFRLVYSSEYAFVLVYEIDYEADRT
jgi:dolichyl-diphosphooligosaccharide--protein glycosyltransferase